MSNSTKTGIGYTKVLRNTETGITLAAGILVNGGVVAVPTETVYGLAVLSANSYDVEQLYAVKGRTPDKPIAWLIAGSDTLWRYCHRLPPDAISAANAHHTVIVFAERVGAYGKAEQFKQGFRVPNHRTTLKLLKLLQQPLACTSANPSGEPPATDVKQVLQYFDGKIAAVLDGGPCKFGRASRVIDFTVSPPVTLRH